MTMHDPYFKYYEEKGIERRTFLKWAVGILSAAIAAVLAWPIIASVIGPVFRLPKMYYVKIGPIDSYPIEKPISTMFNLPTKDAYLNSTTPQNVWIIRHPSKDVTVYSPICPHLGCRYEWYSDAKKFICPCHESVFSIEGKVLGGPAPRPLDTLPHKIENGVLYVKWERFEVGVSEKIRIG
jgi:menaquinol-cytochrome c reductase iron-sulfur subunit